MRARNRDQDEQKGVPAWLISFTDMITLLLAFFVLLQSFAHEQDPELFYQGQGSFRRAVAGLGMPSILLGKDESLELEYTTKHNPAEPDEEQADPRERIIDAVDDRIRRRFADLKEMEIFKRASNIESRDTQLIANIRFARGRAELSHADRDKLESCAAYMAGAGLDAAATEIYVIAMDHETPGGPGRWELACQRAQATREALSAALSRQSGRGWNVFAWGGGDNPRWRAAMGLTEKTDVMILVMKKR